MRLPLRRELVLDPIPLFFAYFMPLHALILLHRRFSLNRKVLKQTKGPRGKAVQCGVLSKEAGNARILSGHRGRLTDTGSPAGEKSNRLCDVQAAGSGGDFSKPLHCGENDLLLY